MSLTACVSSQISFLSDIYPSMHTVLSMLTPRHFAHILIQSYIPAAGYAEAVKANRIGSETARTRRHDIKHIFSGRSRISACNTYHYMYIAFTLT